MAEVAVAGAKLDHRSPLADEIIKTRNRILGNARAANWAIEEAQLDDRHIVRRMVLKRCIYGVDKNPMAVELAKVALWLHTFTVGAPLPFVDHHLRAGDSLFGLWVRDAIDRAEGWGGGQLLYAGPLREAQSAAAAMQVIERLTDAEIAEAHQSADTFYGVQQQVAPLDGFMAILHALDWLDLKGKEDKAARVPRSQNVGMMVVERRKFAWRGGAVLRRVNVSNGWKAERRLSRRRAAIADIARLPPFPKTMPDRAETLRHDANLTFLFDGADRLTLKCGFSAVPAPQWLDGEHIWTVSTQLAARIRPSRPGSCPGFR